jgi:cytochrome c oxidase subunit 1
MGVAAVFGIFSATYFWFPKMFGRTLNETLGQAHFWLTFVGVYAIFVPFHLMGMLGHPRRIAEISGYDFLKPLASVHVFITIAAIVTAAAQVIFLTNLIVSLVRGARAIENPWQATTLEWTIASPPPHDNFGRKDPIVYRGPYDFSLPGAERDFAIQTDADTGSALAGTR